LYGALTRPSAYFREHLAAYDGQPLSLAGTTLTLKLYLDLIHLKSVPARQVYAARDTIFAFCAKYESPGIAERAVVALHQYVDKDAWGVFAIASQHNNVALAKAALKAMVDDHDAVKVTALTPTQVVGVALPYLLGIYHAALQVDSVHPKVDDGTNGHGHGHDHGFNHGQGWKAIADKFHPIVG
jgi:hypothetical protein